MTEVHPVLRQDCLYLGHFALSHLLLMRDANYPWCILVPDRDGIQEIFELDEPDQRQLLAESSLLARVMFEGFRADKLNVAALGNVVPQLHLHHVVRYRHDGAWPAPVWGRVEARAYQEKELVEVLTVLRQGLGPRVRFEPSLP